MQQRNFQIFISSRFTDFQGVRSALQSMAADQLDFAVDFIDLLDDRARLTSPAEESMRRAEEADVVIFLLGSTYGELAPGRTVSYVELEYEAASRNRAGRDRTSLIYIATLEPESGSQRKLIKEATRSSTYAEIDSDRPEHELAEQILSDLNYQLRELNQREVQRQRSLAAPGLGPQIITTRSYEWSNDEIGPLDLRLFGRKKTRPSRPNQSDLVERSADEWGEVGLAYNIQSTNLTIEHLDRIATLRPLDGNARYWIARLRLSMSGDGPERYEQVVEDATVAAAVLRQAEDNSAVAMAELVKSKAFRAIDEYEKAKQSSFASRDAAGNLLFEPNLELFYTAYVQHDDETAYYAIEQAFIIFPRSLRYAYNELERLKFSDDRLRGFEATIRQKVLDHRESMMDYGNHLSAQSQTAAHRVDEMRARLSVHGAVTKRMEGTCKDRVKEPHRPPGRTIAAGPATLVRDGFTLTAKNLERLRDYEGILQTAATAADDAMEYKHHLEHDFYLPVRFGLYGLAAALASAVITGALTESGSLSLLVGALIAFLVVALMLRLNARHNELKHDAGNLLDDAAEIFSDLAEDFVALVRDFERAHLMWRTYAPKSPFPDYSDEDVSLRIRREQVEQDTRTPGQNRILAPDLWKFLCELDPFPPGFDEPSDDRHFGLYGAARRRRRGAKWTSGERWKAYRHPGTGFTPLIDEASDASSRGGRG